MTAYCTSAVADVETLFDGVDVASVPVSVAVFVAVSVSVDVSVAVSVTVSVAVYAAVIIVRTLRSCHGVVHAARRRSGGPRNDSVAKSGLRNVGKGRKGRTDAESREYAHEYTQRRTASVVSDEGLVGAHCIRTCPQLCLQVEQGDGGGCAG